MAALAVVLALVRPRHRARGPLPWLVLVLVVAGLAGWRLAARGWPRSTGVARGGEGRPRGAARNRFVSPADVWRAHTLCAGHRTKVASRSNRARPGPPARAVPRIARLFNSRRGTRDLRSRLPARCGSRPPGSGRRSSARVRRSCWPPTTSRRPARPVAAFAARLTMFAAAPSRRWSGARQPLRLRSFAASCSARTTASRRRFVTTSAARALHTFWRCRDRT